jgi:hypothetical protein
MWGSPLALLLVELALISMNLLGVERLKYQKNAEFSEDTVMIF